MNRPVSTSELRTSERTFVAAMQQLGYGRFEFLRIERGERVLDPWPTTVREIKFPAKTGGKKTVVKEFLLKQQVIELVEYVRSVNIGEIQLIVVKNGLPFSMEIELVDAISAELVLAHSRGTDSRT
jgi:hypothetical protein